MRTIVEIPNDVVERLDLMSGQRNLSRAALIRDAIAVYLEQEGAADAGKAFGLWKGRSKDGLAYQSELRSEWD